jgi:hypothetical protein
LELLDEVDLLAIPQQSVGLHCLIDALGLHIVAVGSVSVAALIVEASQGLRAPDDSLVIESEGGVVYVSGVVGLASLLETVVKGRVEVERVSFAAGLEGAGTVVGSGGDVLHLWVVLDIHILFVKVELCFEVEEVEHGTLSN